MKEKNKEKRTNFYVVSIYEEGWDEELLKKAGGKIATVYFYNRNEVTYCCSPIPTYTLWPLYSFADTDADIDDEVKDDVDDGHRGSTCVMNVECSVIDEIKEKYKHRHVKVPASKNGRYWSNEGLKYKEIYDKAEDYLRGNHLI